MGHNTTLEGLTLGLFLAVLLMALIDPQTTQELLNRM
jgi:hypothetical protein